MMAVGREEITGRSTRMMTKLVVITDRVSSFMAILAGLEIVALVLLNVYAVVMRYLFNTPVNWPIDTSEMLLVATVFLGGAYTLSVDGHINIPILVVLLSNSKQRALAIVWYLLISAFALVLMWKGTDLAWQNLCTVSWSISRLPLFPSYTVVPIGAFLLLAQALSKLIKGTTTD
jgi:TRAP-type C4-dicarboxylate transport system permease small subunit